MTHTRHGLLASAVGHCNSWGLRLFASTGGHVQGERPGATVGVMTSGVSLPTCCRAQRSAPEVKQAYKTARNLGEDQASARSADEDLPSARCTPRRGVRMLPRQVLRTCRQGYQGNFHTLCHLTEATRAQQEARPARLSSLVIAGSFALAYTKIGRQTDRHQALPLPLW